MDIGDLQKMTVMSAVFVLPNLLTYLLLMKFSNVLVFTSPVSMLMKYRVASRSAVVLRSFSSAELEILSLSSHCHCLSSLPGGLSMLSSLR